MRKTIKALTVAITLFLSSCGAYANTTTIITLPDGSQMVCFTYNEGRFIDCQKL